MALLAISIIATCIIASYCIYESSTEEDELFLSSWKSDEVPLGPLDVSSLTMEFLKDNNVSILTTSKMENEGCTEKCQIHGKYSLKGAKVIFHKLYLHLDEYEVSFLEAERSGEFIFLTWCINTTPYPFTTALHRISENENKLTAKSF